MPDDIDKVSHPGHYNKHKMECIDVIRVLLMADEFRGFCLGNELKYRWRAGDKPGESAADDLAKAKWYEDARSRARSIDPSPGH